MVTLATGVGGGTGTALTVSDEEGEIQVMFEVCRTLTLWVPGETAA